jgi:BirA family biotin operon repressor/biotin-[acetyl-CoA-carboxylase] ligase
MNIIKINSCGSTNAYLKELSKKQNLEEGTFLSTWEQVEGRGQNGTYWEAKEGKNLTFSVIFSPDFVPITNYFLLSEAVALGVKECLDLYTDFISIKWPNDIYYKDKKIAGILIENSLTGQILSQSIVGIGINVNQEIFCSNAPNPISIKQIIEKETDLDLLLEQLSGFILSRYEQLRRGEIDSIVKDYHSALYRNTGFHLYRDKETFFRARIECVSNDGLLHLITDEEEKSTYSFKEVAFFL